MVQNFIQIVLNFAENIESPEIATTPYKEFEKSQSSVITSVCKFTLLTTQRSRMSSFVRLFRHMYICVEPHIRPEITYTLKKVFICSNAFFFVFDNFNQIWAMFFNNQGVCSNMDIFLKIKRNMQTDVNGVRDVLGHSQCLEN